MMFLKDFKKLWKDKIHIRLGHILALERFYKITGKHATPTTKHHLAGWKI